MCAGAWQGALDGAGITLAEESAAEHHVKAGRLARVLPDWEWPPVTLRAVFSGRKLMPARTRVFIDALVSAFGSHGKSWCDGGNVRSSRATTRTSPRLSRALGRR